MSTDGRGWRKLQRIERASHRLWPVMARAIRDHLLRLPDDIDGIIFPSSSDPVRDLLQALGAHPSERKAIGKAIRFLLDDGYLQHVNGCLSIRNFEKEQADGAEVKDKKRADAAERQRRKRERDKQAKESDSTTSSHVTVTRDVTEDENVTSRAIREEKRREEEEEGKRDNVTVSRDDVTRDEGSPPPPTILHDSDRETICPLSLALPFDARQGLAKRLKVSVDDVAAAEHEFVTYWTIGPGAGKRRSHWVAKLRGDVCEKSKRGQLAGLGGQQEEVEQCY